MDDAHDPDDERLRLRQDAVLYPLGRTLRSTFDADNHATLSAEVTALMIDLSHVPYEPYATGIVATPAPAPQPPASLIARVRTLLLG